MSLNCTNFTLPSYGPGESVVFASLYLLMGIFICGGNILTIVAVWRTRVLRTIPNMFVVSLAVADLMVGAFVVPIQFLSFIPTLSKEIRENKYDCLFHFMLTYSSVWLSVFFMMVIAFDRVLYIGYPFIYQTMVTVHMAKIIIFSGCVLSLGFGIFPLLAYSWDECSACALFGIMRVDYQLYGNFVSFGIVCFLTSICYGYIFKIARQHRRRFFRDKTSQVMSQIEHDIKLIKIYFLVFGIFFLSWSPNMLVIIVDRFTRYPIPQCIIHLALLLGLLNSGMNFLVYSIRNEDFRKAFKKMLFRHNRIIPDNLET
ncbi:hypothetical protein SNE40_020215 [Patella caerulea]|uniref:G-protein coupled receptors family 1 profile domain-containing protein n=1 Tax=Patella caerulea TaxID=87958 RepID=A0AAN8IZG6_PATCE